MATALLGSQGTSAKIGGISAFPVDDGRLIRPGGDPRGPIEQPTTSTMVMFVMLVALAAITLATANGNAEDTAVAPRQHYLRGALRTDGEETMATRELGTVPVVLLAKATPPPPRKSCRRILTTQCEDYRPLCINDCNDETVQVLTLQEAQDAYISQRGLLPDALGVYVDYRGNERLDIDSLPPATEWLFVSGLQLNGKRDFDFPHNIDQLSSVFLVGSRVSSIEKVNFPDHVDTVKLVGTSVQNLINARFPDALRLLDASSNQINALTCCGFPEGLEELYLSYNALDKFQHMLLPSTLQTLSINWNRVTTIRNITLPETLTRFYFEENPIQLISLSTEQWDRFLNVTGDAVALDSIPTEETTCVTGYFGPNRKDEFLACLLGEEPITVDIKSTSSGAS